MQKQKLKEFRVCTNISCSNIMEKEKTNIVKTAKGSARINIPVFIQVCKVFFPGQVTIASINT